MINVLVLEILPYDFLLDRCEAQQNRGMCNGNSAHMQGAKRCNARLALGSFM